MFVFVPEEKGDFVAVAGAVGWKKVPEEAHVDRTQDQEETNVRKEGNGMGSIWGAALKTAPKAKPLAKLLVAEAAKQGATLEELELAAKIAAHVYEYAMRSAGLSEFSGEAQAALDRI